MDELQATAVMIALFGLRCVAPLAITLILGYLMNRLVDRWRAEHIATEAEENIPDPVTEPSTGIKLPYVTVPCWILRNCEPADQVKCPARQHPGLPCWLVRMRFEGSLPDTCSECAIYTEGSVAIA